MGSSCSRTKLLHWSESRFHLRGPAQPLGKVSCSNSIRSARPWFSNRRSSRLKNSRCRPSSRHPIVLTPALRRMTHRSGHERMRPGHHQFMMQRVAKTARLINAMDRMPSVHLGPNPVEQSCAGEALPRLMSPAPHWIAVTALFRSTSRPSLKICRAPELSPATAALG